VLLSGQIIRTSRWSQRKSVPESVTFRSLVSHAAGNWNTCGAAMAERILMNEYKSLAQEKWVNIEVRHVYPSCYELRGTQRVGYANTAGLLVERG